MFTDLQLTEDFGYQSKARPDAISTLVDVQGLIRVSNKNTLKATGETILADHTGSCDSRYQITTLYKTC